MYWSISDRYTYWQVLLKEKSTGEIIYRLKICEEVNKDITFLLEVVYYFSSMLPVITKNSDYIFLNY